MQTLLVVDDSPVERQLVALLLSRTEEWSLLEANSGEQALELMSQHQVDVVLTDLQMGGMTGLDLLEQIHQRTSECPVIVMTSRGSEEIAMRALHNGAAGYVPKSCLSRDLVDIVGRVSSSARTSRDFAQLMESMTETQFVFLLDNSRSRIPAIVHYLQDGLARFDVCDERDRVRIGVALEEALANAIVHGNLEVSSELRSRDDNSWQETIEARAADPRYASRRVELRCRINSSEAVFTIRDEGPGFAPSEVPDPTDLENLGKPSGRGIMLIRCFMDEVRYNETGNEITMIKHRPTEQDTSLMDSAQSIPV